MKEPIKKIFYLCYFVTIIVACLVISDVIAFWPALWIIFSVCLGGLTGMIVFKRKED